MTPYIVSECSVRSFRFYMNGCLYEGIRYGNKLYRLVKTFGRQEEDSLYTYCCQFMSNASPEHSAAIVTTSRQQYRIWTELRTELPSDVASAVQYA
ncbi:MAG: hypothetical protein Fur0046_15690 [Cyanobacteria bacterium J069]|nr:MAG: hypothetical protein D6742_20050 [Cyanobacteria bacterium J069]